MSAKHPYISGPGAVSSMILQLRNSFPQMVSSDTVKKLGLAPNNESYVINALQFIGAIDEEGKKTDAASSIFSQHDDKKFADQFGSLIRSAYDDIFELYGDRTWHLSKDDLITFFRNADQTSAIIGGRQANLFLTFAALSGYGEIKTAKQTSTATTKITKPKSAKTGKANPQTNPEDTKKVLQAENSKPNGFGLSVRVEVNLPSDASPEAYDAIFASIRKNLIDSD